jgi:hypothetical protein
MSIMLPLEQLTTILQIFAQEMTVVVANNYGYILKSVGDAVGANYGYILKSVGAGCAEGSTSGKIK